MIIKDKQIENYQLNNKTIIFRKINELTSTLSNLIESITKQQNYIGTTKILPNIGFSLSNKLLDISQQFQKVGISIFSSNTEQRPSIIEEATVVDMINKAQQGLQFLENYNSEFQTIYSQKFNPFKKAIIKSKQKTLLSYLEQYCKIDTQLWNYSLPNNIIPNIVNYMKIKEYSKQDAFSILYEYVIPDLHKLGLENVIPDLKETLDKSYTTHLQNSWDLPPDEKSQIQKQQQQIAKTYNQNFKTLEITKSNYIKE